MVKAITLDWSNNASILIQAIYLIGQYTKPAKAAALATLNISGAKHPNKPATKSFRYSP